MVKAMPLARIAFSMATLAAKWGTWGSRSAFWTER
jgi:hypothetical protein